MNISICVEDSEAVSSGRLAIREKDCAWLNLGEGLLMKRKVVGGERIKTSSEELIQDISFITSRGKIDYWQWEKGQKNIFLHKSKLRL